MEFSGWVPTELVAPAGSIETQDFYVKDLQFTPIYSPHFLQQNVQHFNLCSSSNLNKAGCITRKEAQTVLLEWARLELHGDLSSSGNFVLRKNRKQGFYCLSVLTTDYYHYKINESPGEFGYGKVYDLYKMPVFNSLDDLINHYTENELRKRLKIQVELKMNFLTKVKVLAES